MPTLRNPMQNRRQHLAVKQIGALGLAVCMVGSPAGAVEAVTNPLLHELSAADVEATALPSGDSAAFRERMMDWKGEPQPKSAVIERKSEPPTANRLAISSSFGWRRDPLTGGQRRHAGVDLPSRTGTDVYATGPGRVISAGWTPGYGNLVEIEHAGGLQTRYGHLSRILVNLGSAVVHGQLIGQVGSTGRSTGPHLHYEIRIRGVAVDPTTFMGQDVPTYVTAWAAEPTAQPRWVGWTNTDALPQSLIE